jgi:hypothetical protein
MCRPKNAKELFNLRHASARNVIERIFGILKKRFRILLLPPEYDMEIQARIPSALCALHNFIRQHDPLEFIDLDEELGSGNEEHRDHGDHGLDGHDHGELSTTSVVDASERDRARTKRDHIANEMWVQYQLDMQSFGDE